MYTFWPLAIAIVLIGIIGSIVSQKIITGLHRYLERTHNMNENQRTIDKFLKQQNWPYWKPMSILARLMEECGELARLVNHLFGEKPKKDDEAQQNLEEELGDILFTVICFANSQNINLDQALQKTIEKVGTRDKNRFITKRD